MIQIKICAFIPTRFADDTDSHAVSSSTCERASLTARSNKHSRNTVTDAFNSIDYTRTCILRREPPGAAPSPWSAINQGQPILTKCSGELSSIDDESVSDEHDCSLMVEISRKLDSQLHFVSIDSAAEYFGKIGGCLS